MNGSSAAPSSTAAFWRTRASRRCRSVSAKVANLPAALDQLASHGAELIDETPREGLFGLQVAFVHPDSAHGVLSEIVTDGQ